MCRHDCRASDDNLRHKWIEALKIKGSQQYSAAEKALLVKYVFLTYDKMKEADLQAEEAGGKTGAGLSQSEDVHLLLLHHVIGVSPLAAITTLEHDKLTSPRTKGVTLSKCIAHVAEELCVAEDQLGTSVCEYISREELSEPASRAKVVTFEKIGDLTPEYLLEICAYIDHQKEVEGQPVSALMIKNHLKSGKRIHAMLNGSEEGGGGPPLDFVDVPENIIKTAMKKMLGFTWGKVGLMCSSFMPLHTS